MNLNLLQSRILQPISVLLTLMGLFILFSAFASFLGAGIIKLVSGVSFDNLASVEYWEKTPYGRWYMLSMQAISALGSFIGTFWCYRTLFEAQNKPPINTHNEKFISYFLIIFLVICLMPFSAFISELNQKIDFGVWIGVEFGVWVKQMELKLELLTKFLINFDSFPQFLFGILVIGVLPGIGEELLFRGILQRKLNETINFHVAIWLSAALFSAIHLQFLGFFPRMILGAMFGYLYYFSGDLKTAIFAHFVNNSFTLLLAYLYQTNIIKINIVEKLNISPFFAFIFLFISLSMFVFIYQKIWKKKMIN
ncbi:MAG: CPBP family intramembrane metalloprotease [Bacteroidetes bacterium]|nr:MAG: CPBP family intramembrane metalloprotease [Bacteroidota bacterium]TAG85358.1 MAG: CPBP family intramembrane metalloprotease [Bacteroidota bacterium]